MGAVGVESVPELWESTFFSHTLCPGQSLGLC